MRPRTLAAAAAVVGVASGVVLGARLTSAHRAVEPAKSSSALFGTVSLSGPPFPGAEEVSLADAEQLAAYHLYRPNDAMASDSTISTVWYGHVPPDEWVDYVETTKIDYQSGIVVFIDRYQLTDDPKVTFEKMAAEFGAPTSVTTVQGVPALVIPPNSDEDNLGPAAVQMVIDRVLIGIAGDVSVEDIERIAGTVQ